MCICTQFQKIPFKFFNSFFENFIHMYNAFWSCPPSFQFLLDASLAPHPSLSSRSSFYNPMNLIIWLYVCGHRVVLCSMVNLLPWRTLTLLSPQLWVIKDLQLEIGLLSPCPIYAGIMYGLILCRSCSSLILCRFDLVQVWSCVGNHSHCEFMSAGALTFQNIVLSCAGCCL